MGACFGIDLIKVLFKGFFGKPVKSVWEPLICRELVKDVLLFFSFFFVAVSTVVQIPFAFNSCLMSRSGRVAGMPPA